MIKRILIWFFVGILFVPFRVFPAPCYGTKMPEKNKFFIGFETNNIFKRYLEGEYGKTRSLQHHFLLSYGLRDWVSIDLKVGTGLIKQRPVTSSEIDYPSFFSGGYGFRVKLYEEPGHRIRIVSGFQHVSVHPEKIHLEGQENTAILDDWQLSFLVSKDFARLTPYFGAKWSRLDYIHRIGEDRKRRMSDLTKSVGAIFGMDFSLNDKTYLNLETHFFDEESFSLGLLYKF